MKHLDIDDDPLEDLLVHLKETCDWIEASLGPETERVGVLVHCTQGISRSGAIVVAYCKYPGEFYSESVVLDFELTLS
jgi:protein-tyrosine phosphatase